MMQFLDKIYGYEHFGIILFAVIAVLVVLFLIVLFFGKKDEKKREIERTQQLAAQGTTDAFAPVNDAPVAININEQTMVAPENVVPQAMEPTVTPVNQEVAPIPVVPAIEPVVPVAPVLPEVEVASVPVIESASVAPVLEPTVAPELVTQPTPVAPVIEPVIQPEVKLEPVNIPVAEPVVEPAIPEEPKTEIEIPNFNFDELAASIASELNSIENIKPEQQVTPVIPETPVVAPVTPMSDVVKPTATPGPQVFSSVYLNKPVKEVQVVEPEQSVVPVEQPVIPKPVQNPGIELPKPAEMPILNKEVNEPVNSIPNAIPDFSQFEGESYELK